MRRLFICLVLLGVYSQGFGQMKRDPRVVGLAGAYGTVADGIFSVGYNPALIAFQTEKPFMLQLVGLDLGFVSNFVSMSTLNSISGDTLSERDTDRILRNLDRSGGLSIIPDFHMALPFLNFASGNMAITNNTMIMQDITLPRGFMELLLKGNAHTPDLDMTLNYEILGVNELAFSFAVPYEQFALGVTVKYLQGLFYLGIDPDSSYSHMVTTNRNIYGSGTYFLRQGVGGNGVGMDFGFVTRDVDGWRFGASLINAIGSIKWNNPSLIKDMMAGSDNIYGNEDDLFHFTWNGEAMNDSMAVRYTFKIDSVTMEGLSNEKAFTKKQRIVYNLDEKGRLKEFITNYPGIFRLGMSRRVEDYLFTSDIWTGFEDRFFTRAHWKWALGVEVLKFPSVPIRLGYAWGGPTFKELGMGLGIHKGPLIFDIGFAFRNGIWIHTMKGFNLSLGLTITSFGSRKTEALPDEGSTPAPEPAAQPKS